ncbi:MAG: histidine kinase dimerization/phosphoacceptor domain -containing protein [Cyanobacteria bacterium J06634_6]
MTQTATELRATPEELHTASRSPAIDTSPLVLIADDEPTARLLLRAAMQKENFRVIEARNGRECLELCEQQQPDIVLMDAMMPEIDGFGCCVELRSRPENEAPPVLMITSLDDPASIDRIFAVGATDYIAKPIHWALLRQRVFRLQDIVKRRQAEAKIRASLKEKEALLKEVHHRVKNNLQIITSLLNLQSDSITDQRVLDIFKESQNRVHLMALIHEKLYQSDDLGRISLRDYIQSLSENLLRSYEVGKTDVHLTIQADDISLVTDTAVSCGLIINELVSNSLKYAFSSGHPSHRENSITIEARQTDQNLFCIRYEDNGIGLPDTIDIQNTETLGLQLVTSLTQQLGGAIAICSNGGTCFELTALQAS